MQQPTNFKLNAIVHQYISISLSTPQIHVFFFYMTSQIDKTLFSSNQWRLKTRLKNYHCNVFFTFFVVPFYWTASEQVSKWGVKNDLIEPASI